MQMKLKRLGRTGFMVSEFCLGTYQITGEFGVPRSDAFAVIRRAFESGVNFVDTAQMYGAGESEELVGRIAAEYPEKQIIISSKVGHLGRGIVQACGEEAYRNEDMLARTIDHSLNTLHRDKLDMFMIHEPDWAVWGLDPKTGDAPVMNVLERYKREGVIGAIGLGTTNADNCADLIETGRFDAFLIAIQYDLVVRAAKERLIPAAKKLDVGVIVGTPFRQGVLVKKLGDDALLEMGWGEGEIKRIKKIYEVSDECGMGMVEMAIRYVISDPDVDCMAIGAQTAAQFDMNLEALNKGPLPADIYKRLDEI